MISARKGVAALALLTFVSTIAPAADSAVDLREDAVYLMTNQANNSVMAFDREPDGTLTFVGSFLTGGAGNPLPVPNGSDPPIDPLASQGSLVLSDDGHFLFAVNAGNSTLSVFVVKRDGLTLRDNRIAGALRPISLTVHEDLLYVLTDGGGVVGRAAPSIVGFRIGRFGFLSRLQDSIRILARGVMTDPAQIAFNPAGNLLFVTDKLNNQIFAFPVQENGLTLPPVISPSNGQTPFGFGFDGRGHLFVSEAAGGAPGASTVSSYELMTGGSLGSISAAIPDSQTAACWIALTPDKRFAYVSNAGSGQVSSYRILDDGQLELMESTASRSDDTSGPIDLAISRDGKRLYVHQAGKQTIAVFKIEVEGNLNRRHSITGLPFGAQGIAAR